MIKEIFALSTFLGLVFVVCWLALAPILSSFTMLRGSMLYEIGGLVIFILPIFLVVFVVCCLYISGKCR